MRWLSDEIVRRLTVAADLPDLSGTRYRVRRKLGSGGMGTVYLAYDIALDREVALKVTNSHDDSSDPATRMAAEARIMALLEHPFIAPVHDAGALPDGRFFYAMKYVQGRRLDLYAGVDAGLRERLRTFQKICEAVAFAHSRGVIHRDLKPENIMVGEFGEVLVMDWGVAKILKSPEFSPALEPEFGDEDLPGKRPPFATSPGTVMGTPAYMAPEQAAGDLDRMDTRIDVYALGAILYFLLTGRAPFQADSAIEIRRLVMAGAPVPPRTIDEKIPKQLEAICRKAMSREPRERYVGVPDLSRDIERYLDETSVSAYRENLFDRTARFVRRNRFLVLLVLAYIVMRAVVLLVTGR